MLPGWIGWLISLAAAIVTVRMFRHVTRRPPAPGIMHDRNALARKFNTTPEDIIEVKPPAKN
jgi:hypothetical protein